MPLDQDAFVTMICVTFEPPSPSGPLAKQAYTCSRSTWGHTRVCSLWSSAEVCKLFYITLALDFNGIA
eukprot:1662571-Amphidinium_carterae.1